VVICQERDADLHMAQLMPLSLTVSCFSKIQIRFTFLVPAQTGSPGQRAIKRVCMCVLNSLNIIITIIIKGKEVVREDCQARKLNKEDAMDRCKWRKMIKEAR